ncbi:hypothetical protein Q6346_07895 [Isoptericola sp. b490]|uniref:hypothetical protein n=1 Tax=Actinotalea lenta TaxID=3064654 RepID=UPI002712AE75|nr:hypothetical protein [Isoptericola sp. b490]MDO8121232.1 hypothetical protein [Isoptericola sp. b490]
MAQLKLLHLTFIGTNVEPAAIEFGPEVTLVRGPSDTGKSFIVDAIDFMFGANALKEIPEREGYSTVLLGIEMPDGKPVTLSRSVEGGPFGLYRSDLRGGPLPPPDEVLAAKHNPASGSNISTFLLQAIGLDNRRVRKNVRNATDSLSFRNVAHLCVVDETQMQAEIAPALTGSYVTRTKEVSVLKLFLQDEDDSSLVEVESKSELAKVSTAKVEVVDRLLDELYAQLSDTPEVAELREQLARLANSIDEKSESISDVVGTRSTISEGLRERQEQLSSIRTELGDAIALKGRFDILRQKYDSDLARLEAVREAGSLLGYFTVGTCVFCGAEPEHQHRSTDCEGNTTIFADAIDEQARRTKTLALDLQSTMVDLDDRTAQLGQLAQTARSEAERLRIRLAKLEAGLADDNSVLKDLISRRVSLERSLALYDQVEALEKMKRVVVDEATADTAVAAAGIALRAQREFSHELASRLGSWGYPDSHEVRYDANSQDIVADDQLRSAHGKGVRAILHAAFTLSLANYCVERDIPHPGLVVLDTPILTYRPPDQDPDGDGDVPSEIVASFYRDIQRNTVGQVIVMENTDPVEPLDSQTVEVVFTAREFGRYGFFPAQ